jgi:hypothetical protein
MRPSTVRGTSPCATPRAAASTLRRDAQAAYIALMEHCCTPWWPTVISPQWPTLLSRCKAQARLASLGLSAQRPSALSGCVASTPTEGSSMATHTTGAGNRPALLHPVQLTLQLCSQRPASTRLWIYRLSRRCLRFPENPQNSARPSERGRSSRPQAGQLHLRHAARRGPTGLRVRPAAPGSRPTLRARSRPRAWPGPWLRTGRPRPACAARRPLSARRHAAGR